MGGPLACHQMKPPAVWLWRSSGSCSSGVLSSPPGAWVSAPAAISKNTGSSTIFAHAIIPLHPPGTNLGQLALEIILRLYEPRGYRVAGIPHDPGPDGAKILRQVLSSPQGKELWCGGNLRSCSLDWQLLTTFCVNRSLSCFERSTCCLNWWIFKCRLVCG